MKREEKEKNKDKKKKRRRGRKLSVIKARDYHTDYIMRIMTVKTVSGETYYGVIYDANNEKMLFGVDDKNWRHYFFIDWNDVLELIDWGWTPEWEEILNIE